MNRVIGLELEVNFPEDRASANEVFAAVGMVLQSVYEQVTPLVIECYQEHIVELLCSPSGLKAKRGLGLHESKKEPGHRCKCRRFKRAGYWQEERRLRGERGEVSFRPAMVQCRGCGKRLTPVLDALELERYQTHTDLLLAKVIEAIADTSYRRSMDQLSVLAEVPVAKSTAHRLAASIEMPVKQTGEEDLLGADGTGFKKRGPEKGQVRLVLKIGPEGEVQPVGVWAGKSWEEIAADVADQQQGQGRMFFSDGERGLEDWLGPLCERSQRGHWHAAREVGYALWDDKMPFKERRQRQKQVGELIALEIPEEDIEWVSEQDKTHLRYRITQAEEQLDELCQEFENQGYPKASTYLKRARDQLFSHLRLWLDTGIIAPRTTSIVENLIRELVRRLKKIGWNWSDEGATRMGRIVMIRRYDPEEWYRYWNQRINLRGRCKIRILRCQLRPAA
jgi:hypothetical protein